MNNNPILVDSDTDSDSSMFASLNTNQHNDNNYNNYTHHHHHHHHHRHRNNTHNNNINTSKDATRRASTRMHSREIRHTAHCILASKELLLLHALASNESVPRTRRRFMAQVLEPDDPEAALDVALDHAAAVTAGGGSGGGGGGGRGRTPAIGAIQGTAVASRRMLRTGNVVDVVETDDAKGWELCRGSSLTTPRAGKKKLYNVNAGSARKRSQQRVVSGSASASPSRSGIRAASGAVGGYGSSRRDRDDDVEMEGS